MTELETGGCHNLKMVRKNLFQVIRSRHGIAPCVYVYCETIGEMCAQSPGFPLQEMFPLMIHISNGVGLPDMDWVNNHFH